MVHFFANHFSLLFIFTLCFVGAGTTAVHAQPHQHQRYGIYNNNKWVDSVMNHMTTDEKIGQLFMVDGFTYKDKDNTKSLLYLVQHYKIGGVIWFKGYPGKTASAINLLQEKSRIPLMMAIDAEWGLAMRLDSTLNFGYQMNMGAIPEDSVIYRLGREMGRECRRLGIQVSFSPVVDINNNPQNPVINLRSFGENKYLVARKALMYMRGLQDEKVLAVAKHFPGHGDTETDSHLDLPILNQSLKRLDTLELYPFRYLFGKEVGGVMTAHLHIPALDTTPHIGASLSPMISTDLLRRKLKFNGLAFSDAMNMQGVAKYFPAGEIALKAFEAGNDIILYVEDVPEGIHAIKEALDSGCISMDVLDLKVRRILQAKYWSGLWDCHYVQGQNLTEDLNEPQAQILKKQLAERSITVVKNVNNFIPLRLADTMKMAVVSIGAKSATTFQKTMDAYTRTDNFTISMWAHDSVWKKLRDTLAYHYDVVVFGIYRISNKNASYGISTDALTLINEINKLHKTILVDFGSPYALTYFPEMKYALVAWQEDEAYQVAAAEMLMGGISARARLPVTASKQYVYNGGVNTLPPIRMKYAIPEEAGMSSKKLLKIDDLVEYAISKQALPGCQILVVKDGMIVLDKTYGKQLYASAIPVKKDDLYDLASLTKVAATTLAVMKLYDEKRLDINQKLSFYLPELKNTDKADLILKEMLAHQSGLTPFIPFYKETLTENGVCDANYCTTPNDYFDLRVGENLYLNYDYKDTILNQIAKSRLEERGKMKYSDLNFILLQQVVERLTKTPLNVYMEKTFYGPLRLPAMGFNPRNRFPLEQIIPTEIDTYFRHQLVWGDVNDPTAAMLGGVAGHAGLFSNATDVAVLMQLMLNGGQYAGIRFFSDSTAKRFTNKAYPTNRRGLGWDKPTEPALGGPTSTFASSQTFGHQGFTGTCVWSDPKYNLTYVFLSNRVYPYAENNRLAQMGVRTDIHDIIYKAIIGR